MNICRFTLGDRSLRIGLVVEDTVLDLTPAGITTLQTVLEAADQLQSYSKRPLAHSPAMH